MYDLQGKTAIVTGAAAGLGAAVILKFAQEGVNVVACGNHRHDDTDALIARCQAEGVKALFKETDVSREEDIDDLFDTALKEMGDVDFIINNAGIWLTSYVKDMDVADFRRTLDVNLIGPFLLSRRFVNYALDRHKKGRIVNMTSQAAFHGSTSGHAHYASSKAGLVGFTISLAREVAPYGINVNALAPGIMETRMVSAIVDDPERREKYKERIPLGYISTPEEIARVVMFLCSKEADYITGATIDATGGMLMR